MVSVAIEWPAFGRNIVTNESGSSPVAIDLVV